jgi:hypothetical protein
MKKSNIFWVIAGILALGLLVYFLNPFGESSGNENGVKEIKPIEFPITKEWSDTIEIPKGFTILADVKENDVAVIHRYNGGPANGGWDNIVKAGKNRGTNWVAKFYNELATSVCYAIDQNETRVQATLVFTAKRE